MADGETVIETAPAKKKSDLGVRVISAIVMLGVLTAAFLAGGPWLYWLIMIVGAVTYGEFARLVWRATHSPLKRALGLLFGAAYIGVATYVLAGLDSYFLFAALGTVISTDTFAYFSGRTFGGPKLIPSISPNKTWAGLIGGMVGAGIWLAMVVGIFHWTSGHNNWADLIEVAWDDAIGAAILGAVLAVFAQAGDFFQSWLKRKADMKDSSNLIPGHGGFFDRVDGLLPVALIAGAIAQVAT